MSLFFANPAWLWAAIPALLWLWWMRSRALRRPRPIGTYPLFQRALAGRATSDQRRRPRPRFEWRDLAVLFLVLALAQPHLSWSRTAAPLVILVDRSASMASAAEVGSEGSRLSVGLARLRERYGGGVRVEGVPRPWFESDMATAAAAEGDAQALLRTAERLAAAGHRVVILTDSGAGPLPSHLGCLQWASNEANAGLVAAAFDASGRLLLRVAGDADGRALHIEIEGAEARRWGPYELGRDGVRCLMEFAALPPPRPMGWRVRLLGGDGAPWRDANPLDDSLELAPPITDPAVVFDGAASPGHEALLRAFRSAPGVSIVRGQGEGALRLGGEGTGHTLALPGDLALGSPTSPAEGALRGSDALERVARGNVAFGALHPIPPSWEGAPVRLWVGEQPLLVERREPIADAPSGRMRRRFLLLADPARSNWPRQASFPLVWTSLLEELAEPRVPGRVWRGDRPIALPLQLAPLTERRADGSERPLTASRAARPQASLTVLGLAAKAHRLAVAPLSRAETMGSSGASASPGATLEREPDSAPRTAFRDLTAYLAIAAALLLVASFGMSMPRRTR